MSDQPTQTQESKPDGQRFYHAQTGYQLILSLSRMRWSAVPTLK
jgi:uncharacterized protein